MTDEIGTAAGKIWQTLRHQDKSSATRLAQQTGLSRNDVQRALGWLAREGKIGFNRIGRSEYVHLIEQDSA